MTSAIHPWERAGLGKAPFRWLGVRELRGPLRFAQADGTVLEVGAPGQPMGSCAYCAQGIAECHSIASADGKRFVVGCDCVARVMGDDDDDRRLARQVDEASKKLRRGKARARAAAKASASAERLPALLADPAVRAALAARPSRHAWKAERGETALDDAEWIAARCGAAGRARLIGEIEAALSAAGVAVPA